MPGATKLEEQLPIVQVLHCNINVITFLPHCGKLLLISAYCSAVKEIGFLLNGQEEGLFTTLTINLCADSLEESRNQVNKSERGKERLCNGNSAALLLNNAIVAFLNCMCLISGYAIPAIKAAILIQRWFRSYMARLEMRRRYALSIFQSIEYAEEQAQLQLSNFFTFMLDHFAQANENDPDMSSHFYSTTMDHDIEGSDLAMIEYQRTHLHARYVLQLLHETRKVLQQMPNITQVSTSYAKEITICGDLHGKLDDLLLIFYKPPVPLLLLQRVVDSLEQIGEACGGLQVGGEDGIPLNIGSKPVSSRTLHSVSLTASVTDLLMQSGSATKEHSTAQLPEQAGGGTVQSCANGLPSEENPYIFNGDFVDRGKNSTEILIILFAFLLVYPNHLHLNRGNHEDHIMNLRYGFTKEVMKKYRSYGKTILHLLQDVFSWLPLATLIDGKVLILHGGISDSTDLNFLKVFQRNKLKSVVRPRKSNAETRKASLIKDTSHLMEAKECHSEQHKSSKEPRTTSASSKRRPHSLDLDNAEEHVGGICDTNSSNSLGEMQHLKLGSVTTSCRSSELTTEEWKQVMDILWSDPRHQHGCTPNKLRGGGCYFGPDVTTRLLKRYNLKMIIRSHECKQEGYEISHNGKVITIFSASNYYEEGSNRGAYIKLNPDLIPRFVQVSKSTRKQTLHQRVTAIELSALKCLREKVFAHKSELIAAFRQYDPNCTGRISVSEWASAIESVLQLDLPWRTLRSRLVYLAQDGSVEYLSSFDDLEIKLPIKEVQPFLVETLCRYKTDLEIIFNLIDRDHSGLISIDEFRQTWKLFNLHLRIDTDDESIDNLARNIDFNKDGSIDFNEFLEAFHVVHKFENRHSD
ncbi:Serine/threonine-protein phosphatase with EF-hands 1 [Varanus komodoensis]|nr:Serine/threonine-protein phosphatase with EF-hands 1 [Varanus komodoensis]